MKWIKIRDFTNYSVSEYGDVRNDKTGRVLAKPLDKDGYVRYCLSENNKRYYIKGHRLVAEHFLDKIKGKEIVNHIDENKQNNHFTNLEWCTVYENNVYGSRLEKATKSCYKKVNCFDLNENFIKTFESLNLAAKETGALASHISSCCSGKRKTAGGYIWRKNGK